MPTIMTHAIVPIGLALAVGRARISGPVMVMGVAMSMAPDADVIGFWFGVEYGDAWGHRGASHSLVFAGMIGVFITAIMQPPNWRVVWAFLYISMASHGLLDMLTDGGLGAAVLWPFSDVRHFAPTQPVAVSPIGISNFLTARGLAVLKSELFWIWMPVLGSALAIFGWRRFRRYNGAA